MKKTLSLILAILMLTALLSGCTEKATVVDDFTLTAEISEEDQVKIDETLNAFMKCFEENNAADALSLLTKDFEATEEDIAAFFSDVHKLTEKPFVPYDSYYMKGLTISDVNIKIKKAVSDTNYIELAPAKSELYCAMYASESEKISYMMTIMLVPEGKNFKIAFINPSDFKYNGEDAPALYEKTKKLHDEGKLIPAYISSCMLGNVIRPGGYFRYSIDTDIEDLCFMLYTEITEKYTLPLALDKTNGASVYEIGIANDETYGIIPLFLVKTNTPVSDYTALKAEAKKVVAAIEKLSPGLYDTFSYAKINATNDSLDENTTSVNSESVVIELK